MNGHVPAPLGSMSLLRCTLRLSSSRDPSTLRARFHCFTPRRADGSRQDDKRSVHRRAHRCVHHHPLPFCTLPFAFCPLAYAPPAPPFPPPPHAAFARPSLASLGRRRKRLCSQVSGRYKPTKLEEWTRRGGSRDRSSGSPACCCCGSQGGRAARS